MCQILSTYVNFKNEDLKPIQMTADQLNA